VSQSVLSLTTLEGAEAGCLKGAVDMIEFAAQVLQLRAEDFSAWWHRDIFEALRWVVGKTGNTSIMSVRQRLLSKDKVDSCNRLMQMYTTCHGTTFGHLKADLDMIRAASLRRTVRFGAEQLMLLADSPDSTREAISQQATAIMSACVTESGHSEAEHVRPILEAYVTRREELAALQAAGKDTSAIEGLPSGLEDVDEIFRSAAGQLIVVAGRPKMGKSILGLQWSWHWSQFGPTYMWSGEMSKDQIASRLISHAEQRPSDRVSCRSIRDLAELSERDGRQLHIDDERRMSPAKLVARVEAFRCRHGLKAVVVDYLGLLCDNDYREVSAAIRLLGQQAGAWGVPLLVLCQLSRKSEDRGGPKEPTPGDLRDSGQIEQQAHTVCLLHRPGYYDKTKDQGLAVLDVALNRNGPSGKVDLLWLPQVSTFQTRRMAPHPPEQATFPTYQAPEFEDMDLY